MSNCVRNSAMAGGEQTSPGLSIIADDNGRYGTRTEPVGFDSAHAAVSLAVTESRVVFAAIKETPGMFEISPTGEITNWPAPPTTQDEASARVKGLAGLIHDNQHFYRILMSAAPELREELYAEIAQYLSFRPMSYRLLMMASGNGHRAKRSR